MTTQSSSWPLDAAITADLIESVAPAELSSDQRAAMRTRILRRVRANAPAGTVTLREREGEWLAVAPGITCKVLRSDSATGRQSYLLRLEPGVVAPAHAHSQIEECLVLEGDALVGDQHLASGDWHVAMPGSSHENFRTISGCLLYIQAGANPRV